MILKKIAAIIMGLALVFSCTSCDIDSSSSESQTEETSVTAVSETTTTVAATTSIKTTKIQTTASTTVTTSVETTTAITTTTDKRNTVIEILKASAYSAFGENCKAEFNTGLNGYTLSVWMSGLSDQLRMSVYDASANEYWNGVLDSLKSSCQPLLEAVRNIELGANLYLLVLDDENLENITAVIYNGEITYNAGTLLAAETEHYTEPTAAPVYTETKKYTETEENQSNSITVYITPTGKKYHYSGSCNGGSYSPTTLDHALALGLTPCKKCAGG